MRPATPMESCSRRAGQLYMTRCGVANTYGSKVIAACFTRFGRCSVENSRSVCGPFIFAFRCYFSLFVACPLRIRCCEWRCWLFFVVATCFFFFAGSRLEFDFFSGLLFFYVLLCYVCMGKAGIRGLCRFLFFVQKKHTEEQLRLKHYNCPCHGPHHRPRCFP